MAAVLICTTTAAGSRRPAPPVLEHAASPRPAAAESRRSRSGALMQSTERPTRFTRMSALSSTYRHRRASVHPGATCVHGPATFGGLRERMTTEYPRSGQMMRARRPRSRYAQMIRWSTKYRSSWHPRELELMRPRPATAPPAGINGRSEKTVGIAINERYRLSSSDRETSMNSDADPDLTSFLGARPEDFAFAQQRFDEGAGFPEVVHELNERGVSPEQMIQSRDLGASSNRSSLGNCRNRRSGIA